MNESYRVETLSLAEQKYKGSDLEYALEATNLASDWTVHQSRMLGRLSKRDMRKYKKSLYNDMYDFVKLNQKTTFPTFLANPIAWWIASAILEWVVKTILHKMYPDVF